MPAFQVTVPGGRNELDVRIWDESTQWMMRIRVCRPTASLVGDAGLPSGRWADLRLDPPSSYVVVDFDSDAGCAHFELTSSRDGTGCTTDYATSVSCDAGLLEAAAGCPVTFNDSKRVVPGPRRGRCIGDLRGARMAAGGAPAVRGTGHLLAE